MQKWDTFMCQSYVKQVKRVPVWEWEIYFSFINSRKLFVCLSTKLRFNEWLFLMNDVSFHPLKVLYTASNHNMDDKHIKLAIFSVCLSKVYGIHSHFFKSGIENKIVLFFTSRKKIHLFYLHFCRRYLNLWLLLLLLLCRTLFLKGNLIERKGEKFHLLRPS